MHCKYGGKWSGFFDGMEFVRLGFCVIVYLEGLKMLTEMLEAALPGKWVVIKRRVRTNVYPSPEPGYEVQCPEFFRFRKDYSAGYEYRHGAHSRHFDGADTIKLMAMNINLAVEPCPPDCDCRREREVEMDGPCCPS